MQTPTRFILIHALLLFGVGDCAYSFRRGDVALGGVKDSGNAPQTIFVPVVDNLTTRTGMETAITSALRDTLASVRGLEVVNDADHAQFLLLTSIQKYTLEHGSYVVTGNARTQSLGGLADGDGTAKDLLLTIEMKVNLLEQTDRKRGLRRVIWSKIFSKSGGFDSAQRFYSTGMDLDSGSATAPLINDSREKFQVKLLSDAMAKQVVDQVIQDF